MGRGTFEKMRDERPWFYTRPVVVLSSSLKERDRPPELADKVRLSDRSPKQAMEMLQSEGHRHVYVDGGQLIRSCLRDELIADMVITRVPVLLGEGRSLFGAIGSDIPLIHQGTQSFPSGLVQSRYRIAV